MESDVLSGPNLQAFWEGLKCLTARTTTDECEQFENLRQSLRANLRRAKTALGLGDSLDFSLMDNVARCGSDIIWDFVETTLYILLKLKEKTFSEDLSVSQQREIRSCLQFVVSLGITPYLLEGVALPVTHNIVLSRLNENTVSVQQKYERLCIVVDTLLECSNNSNFRALIISSIFHYLLSALFQLCFAPIKKPSNDKCMQTPVDENFFMSQELWEKLMKDKHRYNILLNKLVREMYQPKIIFELMLLQSDQKGYSPPKWLKKSASKFLTNCLIAPGGVAALLQASFYSAPDTGNDWKKINALTKIVTSPVNHYTSIVPQLLNLMDVQGSGPHDLHVVVACVRELFQRNSSLCEELLIKPLLQPLDDVFSSTSLSMVSQRVVLDESSIDSLVQKLYLCFASSTSKVAHVSLPGKLLLPYASFFFCLFCRLKENVSYLSKKSESILHSLLSDCDQHDLSRTLKCVLLEEKVEGVYLLPKMYSFLPGTSGGVILEFGSALSEDLLSSTVEDYGNTFMVFLEKINDKELMVNVFEALLEILVDLGMKPKSSESKTALLGTVEDTLKSLMLSSEKHLGIVRLLAVLVENDNVKQKISRKPDSILSFLFKFLEYATNGNLLDEDDELELIFVAFMILNVILDNCSEDTNWSLFTCLLQPVSVIKDRTKNEELKRLASRVCNTITTCGNSNDVFNDSSRGSNETECEEALRDACDPLLPVRGHALVQLSKLIRHRDVETLSKKDSILCLLKENLKSSDSYIYLAAIKGIVALASIEPDKAISMLTQEYIALSSAGKESSRDPEVRMKTGEILVKLVRELRDLAPKYKNELLNAFLVGTKDTDHLMRASSLSNLGEVCQILGFRVGPILRELLSCIHGILLFDKAVEPRRASVMVVTHLFRGLEANSLNVLEDAALELYRTLKKAYSDDEDHVVRLHAQLALEELAKLANDLLFPKLPFHQIRMLS